jgi:protoheme IX farnesyltransferase
LLGTLLVASGTATLNQWMERVWDARMRRTAHRPIPSGRVSAREAFILGMLVSIAGGVYLAVFVNRLAAVLAVSTLLSYLLIYTPLKRHTPVCTLLGAVPGAMPTLIGWAGAANSLDSQAFYLFVVLFVWQFPHFLAIALMYREDYERAGYRMLPRFDVESRFTRSEIVAFTLVLLAATVLPALQRGLPYSALLFVAGSFLLYHTIRLAGSGTRVLAARVLHASVLYLPVALGIMAAAKR